MTLKGGTKKHLENYGLYRVFQLKRLEAEVREFQVSGWRGQQTPVERRGALENSDTSWGILGGFLWIENLKNLFPIWRLVGGFNPIEKY